MKQTYSIIAAVCVSFILTACGITPEEIDTSITQLDTTYQAGTYDEAKIEIEKLDKAYNKMSDEKIDSES